MVCNNLKIDLNSNLADFSCNHDDSDTTLRLECSGYGGSSISKSAQKNGSTLVLGLGPTPSSYSNGHSSSGINKNKKQAEQEEDSVLQLSLSHSTSKSAWNPYSSHYSGVSAFDDCSTSAKRSGGGYIPSLLLAPRISTTNKILLQRCELSEHGQKSYHGCPSESSASSKDSTGTASVQTESCVANGGRRRCSHPTGCSNAARGKYEFCIKHGGGKRCLVEGCDRSAELKPGLCISHGGGKRCWFQGCTNGAQGSTNYCKTHGGGKRCVFSGCTTGAEGSTQLCKAHGGGKRCLYEGGAICPKSVHGGTNFCVKHGGGRRCVVPECTNSARGRTHCCVKHGGGKRCKFENCPKCAQGSTDFCKAHGGGRRCGWEGEAKCEKYARGKGGLCVAHGTMVQESGGGIGPRLFHGLVRSPGRSAPDNNSLSGVSIVSSSIGSLEKPAKRQRLIPPQVLVPSSMKSWAFPSFNPERKERGGSETENTSGLAVPEGRVHGGSLLSLLGGNLRDAVIDDN